MFYRLYHLPRRQAPLCLPSSWGMHALCIHPTVSSRRRLFLIFTTHAVGNTLCAVSQHLRLNQSVKKVHSHNLISYFCCLAVLLSALAYSIVHALCTLAHHFRLYQSMEEIHNRYLISSVSVQIKSYFLPRRTRQATRSSRRFIISASTSPLNNFI